MNAVMIIIEILLGAFIIFAFAKIARINNRIDDIYNKALTMQGEIESNTARTKDNYKSIAKVNTELEKCKLCVDRLTKIHESEVLEVVDAELESLIAEQEPPVKEENSEECDLSIRREKFACLRKDGKSVKEAGAIMGVSYSSAKRYEQWRKDNKK